MVRVNLIYLYSDEIENLRTFFQNYFKEGGIPPLPQGLALVRIFTRYARLTLTGQAFLRNVEVSCRQNL